MPYEQWKTLSPHGQRISRYVMCGKGEKVIGAGYIHPRAKIREAFKDEQLARARPGGGRGVPASACSADRDEVMTC